MLGRKLIFHLLWALMSSSALAAGEPWSDDFVPPPGDYSWIKLDTGEWLKGEIVALYDEKLAFDSDHFGNIDLDLEDVEAVHGRGVFVVSFRDGRPINGTLSIRGQQIFVTAKDGSIEINRSDLVSITPVAERERERWAGDIGFGMNVRQGNTDIAEASIDVGFRRRTPVSRFTIDYLGNINETDGERITDSHRASMGLDRFTGRRLYWRPFSIQYFKDELQNIRHQGTVDSGLGYHVVDTSRIDWELQAGVGYNSLQYVSVADDEQSNETSPVATLNSDLTIEVTSWMDYELLINTTFLNDASGKYQHHIVSALSTDLIGGIDLDFSIVWDRTELPQEDSDGLTPEQDDFWFIVGLTYDF
jgi:putative salt-induced outer membrane protein YdiY